MRKIGRVREVWRYPVSSVGGEAPTSITVSPEGIEGDRRFALFDPETGLAAAPEKETRWRPALFITASQPATGLPVLRFADGAEQALDDGEFRFPGRDRARRHRRLPLPRRLQPLQARAAPPRDHGFGQRARCDHGPCADRCKTLSPLGADRD
uniref:Molybdenum cofactor sulfurase middle domain-containing protein n=1 Tax=Agrobacterium albertimagni TaxID=147266 RepID=A0A7C1T7C7_9HYPH